MTKVSCSPRTVTGIPRKPGGKWRRRESNPRKVPPVVVCVLLILGAAAAPAQAAYVPGCNTSSCDQRIKARYAQKVHRQHQAHKRAMVRPYRRWLASVRACESGGDYRINTGNGYFGAYQFALRSWWAVGGRGYPHRASRLEQDYRAVRLLQVQGAGAWPVCG